MFLTWAFKLTNSMVNLYYDAKQYEVYELVFSVFRMVQWEFCLCKDQRYLNCISGDIRRKIKGINNCVKITFIGNVFGVIEQSLLPFLPVIISVSHCERIPHPKPLYYFWDL